jgi:hypothetical protein
MGFIKKIWNRILDVIAWLTQDNARLNEAKRKTNPERESALQQMRFRIWKL